MIKDFVTKNCGVKSLVHIAKPSLGLFPGTVRSINFHVSWPSLQCRQQARLPSLTASQRDGAGWGQRPDQPVCCPLSSGANEEKRLLPKKALVKGDGAHRFQTEKKLWLDVNSFWLNTFPILQLLSSWPQSTFQKQAEGASGGNRSAAAPSLRAVHRLHVVRHVAPCTPSALLPAHSLCPAALPLLSHLWALALATPSAWTTLPSSVFMAAPSPPSDRST